MAGAAEQDRAPAAISETIEELADGTRSDGLLDATGGRGASPSPDLADDDDQQRRQGDVLDGSVVGEVGADRPTSTTAVEAASGSGGPSIGPVAPAPAPTLTMKEKILALKEEQRQIRAKSKAKTREIRNAERRSKRLKDKVGGLTDEDLNEVLRARAEAKALAAPKAKAKAKAKAGHCDAPAPKRAAV